MLWLLVPVAAQVQYFNAPGYVSQSTYVTSAALVPAAPVARAPQVMAVAEPEPRSSAAADAATGAAVGTAAALAAMAGRAALRPASAKTGAPASRRAVLGSALGTALAAPAVASAMTVPGLNAPGLVPAKSRKSYNYGEGFGGNTVTGDFDYVRDSKINHFWNDLGIQQSVPKVRGIITPKSPTIPGGPGGVTQAQLEPAPGVYVGAGNK